MPTRQERAVRRLWQSQVRAGGVDAVYRRGIEACELVLVRGRSGSERGGQDVEEVVSGEADFILLAESLVIESGLAKPERGDVITIADVEYEVVPRNEPEPWRFTDQTRLLLRVFTVEVLKGEE